MVSEVDAAQPHSQSPLSIWVDATRAGSGLRVFGMTLLERSLRAVRAAGIEPAAVRIESAGGTGAEGWLPDELRAALPIRFEKAEGSLGERLGRALAQGGTWLVLDGDAVVDPRLLAWLAARPGSGAVQGGDGATAVLRLEAPPAADGDDLAALARAAGELPALGLEEVPAYVKKLRRELPAYAFRIADPAAAARAERFLFESNYKGSTDFFTKHVYPPLVWRSLHPLARRRVDPNWISAFNVVITFAAVPLFAAGAWVPGLVLAYAMSVLDSVDGKLARLTYRASRLGHVLDHGLDVIHPPFWYLAWAWALGDGDPASGVFRAALWMTGMYIADRLVTEAFTRTTGRSIHAYAELDVRMRTFISRRNINLPLFTAGLLIGAPVAAFAVIVAWQAATLAFHAVRLVQVGLAVRRSSAGAGAP